MSSSIISVENISKSYVLKHQNAERYTALRDVITNKVKFMFQKPQSSQLASREVFWALNDISFEIKQGERVGIIGRNGAGKSTLLKVLSRIVTPTKGRITIEGRLASLLEVGTGFHPELTGRENIFLNGSILGMSKKEIKRKFDEIVAFSEVEKFLDTPVKRYSSGMYVRLAFSVAAHLEPEILVVDEVLAVGDAEFQKKCLGKMEDVSVQGRTVLFVSHNMGAIRSLCDRCLYLQNGSLLQDGRTDDIIPTYLQFAKGVSEDKGIKVAVSCIGEEQEWVIGSQLKIEISWDRYRYKPGWHADIAVYTLEGTKIFATQSHKNAAFTSDNPEDNGIEFIITNPGLMNHDLRLDIGVRKHKDEPYDIVIQNCQIISPSEKHLPENRFFDSVIAPEIQCRAIKK